MTCKSCSNVVAQFMRRSGVASLPIRLGLMPFRGGSGEEVTKRMIEREEKGTVHHKLLIRRHCKFLSTTETPRARGGEHQGERFRKERESLQIPTATLFSAHHRHRGKPAQSPPALFTPQPLARNTALSAQKKPKPNFDEALSNASAGLWFDRRNPEKAQAPRPKTKNERS